MNKKKAIVGAALILMGIWFYMALSTFEVEEDAFMDNLVINKGIVISEDKVAEALSQEMGFDLEGAYKSGYTSSDVIEYLINEPHEFPVTYHNGEFYQGRKTVHYIIPLIICAVLILTGSIILLVGLRSKKTV